MPRYLRKNGYVKENLLRKIASLRCGNEWLGNRYWLKEEDKRCRSCGEVEETMTHVVWKYKNVRKWDKGVHELFNGSEESIRRLENLAKIKKNMARNERENGNERVQLVRTEVPALRGDIASMQSEWEDGEE